MSFTLVFVFRSWNFCSVTSKKATKSRNIVFSSSTVSVFLFLVCFLFGRGRISGYGFYYLYVFEAVCLADSKEV